MTRRQRVRQRKRINKRRRYRRVHPYDGALLGIYPAQTTADGTSIWLAVIGA